jgi:hypothetical protein
MSALVEDSLSMLIFKTLAAVPIAFLYVLFCVFSGAKIQILVLVVVILLPAVYYYLLSMASFAYYLIAAGDDEDYADDGCKD